MDCSGRINDDTAGCTTEGSLLRERNPEIFYDSYSTRKSLLYQNIREYFYVYLVYSVLKIRYDYLCNTNILFTLTIETYPSSHRYVGFSLMSPSCQHNSHHCHCRLHNHPLVHGHEEMVRVESGRWSQSSQPLHLHLVVTQE